jgi:PIN domain nuclease of toxin-antitoxin system
VHSKLREQRIDPEPAISRLKAAGLEVSTFDEVDAALVGVLRVTTSKLGLSLADRACLALGLRLGSPVLATDRMLANADVGVEVVLIR